MFFDGKDILIKELRSPIVATSPPTLKQLRTYEHTIPYKVIYVKDALFGPNLHSPSFALKGRVKAVINCSEFDIQTGEINGDENILQMYFKISDNILIDELSEHRTVLEESPGPYVKPQYVKHYEQRTRVMQKQVECVLYDIKQKLSVRQEKLRIYRSIKQEKHEEKSKNTKNQNLLINNITFSKGTLMNKRKRKRKYVYK